MYQMYAESNVTSFICHGLGICTIMTNLSVDDVIHLMHSIPTFDTLYYILVVGHVTRGRVAASGYSSPSVCLSVCVF